MNDKLKAIKEIEEQLNNLEATKVNVMPFEAFEKPLKDLEGEFKNIQNVSGMLKDALNRYYNATIFLNNVMMKHNLSNDSTRAIRESLEFTQDEIKEMEQMAYRLEFLTNIQFWYNGVTDFKDIISKPESYWK